MPESAYASPIRDSIPASDESPVAIRHSATVRLTHWLTALSFLLLFVSGVEIVLSHPRFYWGEEGNVNTTALISIPVPASRVTVPTGYGFVLPDQNGWSRSLHFQMAWLAIITGVWYVVYGLTSGHFRNKLWLSRSEFSPAMLGGILASHLRLRFGEDQRKYNPLQRLAYLIVIFGAFPFMIWTGLAMSPAVVSSFPFLVNVLGGHQSARTLHFLDTLFLSGFVAVHILMVCLSGFRGRMLGMITGNPSEHL